ncbi:hypothetical protein V6N13_018107 [Hibiscus sabdariffa]|uniref:Secreted protein n=1 Tax=Hibiscus sabdariffa TaxID=183260 RepID=A0ABR2CGG0_9ROSI
MTGISTSRSLCFLLFFASVSLHFISGLCDDAKDSKNSSKTKSDVVSNTGAKLHMRIELIPFEAETASMGCVVLERSRFL